MAMIASGAAGARALVACPMTGVADRVRLALFGLALARRTGREFKLSWPANRDCGAAFSRVFSTDAFEVLDSDPPGELFKAENATVDELVPRLELALEEEGPDGCLKFHGWVDDQTYADFDNVFRPSIEVATLAAGILSGLGPRTLGVHARVLPDIVGTPPVSEYFRCVDTLLGQGYESLFLASNWPIRVDRFKRRYGPRVSVYPVRSFDRSTEAGIVDAVASVYVLKGLPCLVSSNFSGISRLVAGIGSRDVCKRVSIINKSVYKFA